VIPIIFASSLLIIPGMFARRSRRVPYSWIITQFTDPGAFAHNVLYALLIIFFSFFYTALTFNPVEMADNMKKYGGVIIGVRPGKATAEYLNKVMVRITLVGSCSWPALP
jgi:preprotein translocase subunit SecY